jgi:O-methyltransferase involved in polyketide biosynthesis
VTKHKKRKKQVGAHKQSVSKDLLKEEFGTELGDYNSAKAFELIAEGKSKKNDGKQKEQKNV